MRARVVCVNFIDRKARRAHDCIVYSEHVNVLADEKHQRTLVAHQIEKRVNVKLEQYFAELLIKDQLTCDSGNKCGVGLSATGAIAATC